MKTIQVKPWGEGQGEYVEINEDDFDKDLHELLGDTKPAKSLKNKLEDAKSPELPGDTE